MGSAKRHAAGFERVAKLEAVQSDIKSSMERNRRRVPIERAVYAAGSHARDAAL